LIHYLQVEIAAGDNIRTIVKFLNHGQTQEKERAVSLLFELSENKALSERIGSVSGAILILVGLSSSKVENSLIVDRAEKTLENLESCEKNVRQMAENGRLQPLLRLLLEGIILSYVHVSSQRNYFVLLCSCNIVSATQYSH
jgi:hypothetical protein